jgi:hypothetical protein
MTVLETYLHKVPEGMREHVRALDALVRAADPALEAKLKWGNLTYQHEHTVCALVTHRDHVNLQLWNGASLRDPKGLLEGEGKGMRHVKLPPGQRVDKAALTALVRAAAEAAA